MAFDMVVGLNVVDSQAYQEYRNRMTPMVESYGGTFRYDFTIAEKLKAEAEHPITRLFILSFPTRLIRDQFFKDERYLEVRRTYFEKAISGRTVIAEYDR